jgi:hypothetical protein
MDAFDVLRRREPSLERFRPHALWQRHLNDDAVDGGVGVQGVDFREQRRFGRGGGTTDFVGHAESGRGLRLASEVDLGSRIVSGGECDEVGA